MAPHWIAARGRVLRNEKLPGKEFHYAVIDLPELEGPPAAGQFFMVAPGEEPPPVLLRRPMSVARCWRESGTLRLGFLYTAVGVGTRALAASKQSWKLLGPLGRGYPLVTDAPSILVAGGRGVAPLICLAEELASHGRSVVLLNGARTANELCSPAEMGAPSLLPGSIELESTEDGTRGARGRVLDLLAEEGVAAAAAEPGAVFYSCGPHGLLAAVGKEAARRGRAAWVAAEAHMSCGTGICRSCVLPRAAGSPVPADASNPEYILACLEGPVVEAATVSWEKAP
jgi:dihydroorotate dehydrogenase electron transfer subunit